MFTAGINVVFTRVVNHCVTVLGGLRLIDSRGASAQNLAAVIP